MNGLGRRWLGRWPGMGRWGFAEVRWLSANAGPAPAPRRPHQWSPV